MGVIVALLVLVVLYATGREYLIKIAGNEEKVDKFIGFLFSLLGVLISGYIVFWFIYSAFSTWG